jgi:phage terminase large subunit-like protein
VAPRKPKPVLHDPQGERVVRFFEKTLRHTKGRWGGQPFLLEPFQKEILHALFGTVDQHGQRWYREALIGLSRKNGKSELAAGIALYMLLADGEYAPEVYSVAGDRKQASLVFNTAADMVNASPILRSACRVFRGGKVIEVRENNGIYRALSADADLQHGLNPSCAIIDEYHVHRNSEQYEAMRTGMAARENPLTVTISTAGAAKRGALWDLYSRGMSGDDPKMFTYWRGADDADDLEDRKVWRKANPASWVTMDFLADQHRSLPLPVFARLHLNAWFEGMDESWVTRDQIAACQGEPVLDDGEPVVIAVDAASRRDTTAVMAVQRHPDGKFHRRCWHFNSDEAMGYLDYGAIEALIRELASTFQVNRVAFDPFQMVRSAQMLASEGVPVETFPQNDSRMVPASQLLYDLIVEERLVMDDCPICAEQLLAAGVVETVRGWRLHKLKSAGPIDSAVALAMGVQLAEWEHGLSAGPRVLVV